MGNFYAIIAITSSPKSIFSEYEIFYFSRQTNQKKRDTTLFCFPDHEAMYTVITLFLTEFQII